MIFIFLIPDAAKIFLPTRVLEEYGDNPWIKQYLEMKK